MYKVRMRPIMLTICYDLSLFDNKPGWVEAAFYNILNNGPVPIIDMQTPPLPPLLSLPLKGGHIGIKDAQCAKMNENKKHLCGFSVFDIWSILYS